MTLASIVVPTYHRDALLERCMRALLAQTVPPHTYEVVIVDDAASLETRLLVESYASQRKVEIRYLATSRRASGPAAARNVGWIAAKGSIIAFTDDDCVPQPGWLQAGLNAFTDGVAAVSGRIHMPLPEHPTDYEYNAAQLEESEFATANCFYQRSVLRQAKGFDERFTAAWREDSDLFFTLLEQGHKCVQAPEAVVIHPIRPARWGISLSQQRKSMFNALLYKKHPLLYRERIQARPPWRYYVLIGLLLFSLIALIGGGWRIAALSMLAWSLITGQFCLLRLQKTSRKACHVWEMIITSILIPPLAIFWRLHGMHTFRVRFL